MNTDKHFMREDGKYPPMLCILYIIQPIDTPLQLKRAIIHRKVLRENTTDIYDNIELAPYSVRLIISKNDPNINDYKDVCISRQILLLEY